MKNIVLLGLPGCGKTTLGRAVARKLGMGFLDVDALIEARAGKSIPDIFEEIGEEGFRRLETQAVAMAAGQNGMIVSTGGGVVERQENIRLLQKNGILLFVDRPAKEIAAGMRTSNRPVMQGDTDRIYALEQRRRPLYEQAAHYCFRSVRDRQATEKKLLSLCRRLIAPLRFCVIGDPIGHSLSPEIHMPILEEYTDRAIYEKCHVTAEQLKEFIQTARTHYAGFNATMPHKAALLPLLDEVDADAKALQSVNTVVNRGGKLYGYSTDGAGFFSALAEKGISPQGKRLTILGAGGAAAAVAVKGAAMGVSVLSLLARRPAQAEMLAKRVQAAVPQSNVQVFSMEYTAELAEKTDILVNATPLGMEGTDSQFSDFTFLEALPSQSVVCDLIYKPRPTLLLQKAAQAGHLTMDGLSMLLYQGLLSDQLYLDTTLPLQQKFAEIDKKLFTKLVE